MHHDTRTTRTLIAAAHVAAYFDDWLRSDGEQLIDAAELIGGDRWRLRALEVIQAAAEGVPAGDLYAELAVLRDPLTLEPTNDPWSDEATRLAEIHPDGPRATSAMLCAEALARGLDALDHMDGARTQGAA